MAKGKKRKTRKGKSRACHCKCKLLKRCGTRKKKPRHTTAYLKKHRMFPFAGPRHYYK